MEHIWQANFKNPLPARHSLDIIPKPPHQIYIQIQVPIQEIIANPVYNQNVFLQHCIHTGFLFCIYQLGIRVRRRTPSEKGTHLGSRPRNCNVIYYTAAGVQFVLVIHQFDSLSHISDTLLGQQSRNFNVTSDVTAFRGRILF